MKLIDLFAGAGGLSCGLEMAGYKPVLANEYKPVYAETYKFNNPETEVIGEDIREVSGIDIAKKLKIKKGEIDLLAGGPPCQGFSINAPVRSFPTKDGNRLSQR